MYEDVVLRYLHEDFHSHFRMSRSSMAVLINICGLCKASKKIVGRPEVPISLQCLICVWVLANQESYRSIGDRFNVSKSSIFHCLIRVCKILNSKGSVFIKWPKGNDAIKTIAGFKKIKSFPGVLGAIDGCHINICPPKHNSATYINRKGRPSMILQGVCDHNCIFTDCFVGYPGSVHDARVFQHSTVRVKCNDDVLFPQSSHLLGDSAYPINAQLLTPFRDNGHLNQKQTKFNVCHAATRSPIERAFGILKARWRRLNYLELHNPFYIPHVIMAACILHNFCTQRCEEVPEIINDDNEDGKSQIRNRFSDVDTRKGNDKRIAIMNKL
ncbi:hypothetical protein PPYR_02067 [Photinus pyralis]|uniref:DDE Tnp4 domain-containing protein n=1 Tax=Photinus pyralis TaxID=7054 RepID=A0A5N4B655_PHOPY|nr:hypothetical protein PPYR_02067 [Photinus pyralis]